ncbi:MAG: hypothetical protein AAF722_04740 [Cyanobacteria bacterium P01_C01_bin.70]
MTLFAWPLNRNRWRRLLMWLLAGWLLIWLLAACPATANMANPEQSGDLLTEPWTDVANLDIQHEDLVLDLRSLEDNFLAEITATYLIDNPGAATTVPLLFAAPGLEIGSVVLDNQQAIAATPTETLTIPEDWDTKDFLRPLKGLRFEVPLSPGEHTITVNYQGAPSSDDVDLYRQYTLEYWLAPALQWRSFGTLTVDVLAPLRWETIVKPQLSLIAPAHWQQTFEGLPSDVLTVSARPLLSPLVGILRLVCQVGGVAIAFVVTFWLYRWLGRLSQQQNWSSSWLVLAFLLVIPLSVPLFWGCGGLGIWAAESLLDGQYLAVTYRYSRMVLFLLLGLVAVPTGLIVAVFGFIRGRASGRSAAIARETT